MTNQEMVDSAAERIAESAADFVLNMIADAHRTTRTFDEVAAEFDSAFHSNAEDFANMFLEEFRDRVHAKLSKKQAEITRCEFDKVGFVNGMFVITDAAE